MTRYPAAADVEIDDLRNEIVGLDQKVPLLDGSYRSYVFLDNAASTPAFKGVQNKVNEALLWYSSVHRGSGYKSLISTRAFDHAREVILKFMGGDEDQDVVIFGKNTSEVINLLAANTDWEPGDVVITTLMEHHSNDLPWRGKAQVEHVGVKSDGSLDMEDLEQKLKIFAGRVKFVTCTGASNVTGYINPIHDVAELAHRYGAMVLIDCAQLAPHRAVEMGTPGTLRHIDFVCISAHKMYAPFGTGALIGPKEYFQKTEPDYRGGGTIEIVTLKEIYWAQAPDRMEAGSPNVIGAVALAASMNILSKVGMDAVAAHEKELTRYALGKMKDVPGLRLLGSSDPDRVEDRVGVIPFMLEGMPHAKLAAILSFEGGIGVRNGCFCAHPYILHLLGITDQQFDVFKMQVLHNDRSDRPGLVRASFGCYNNFSEIDHFVEMLERISAGETVGDYRVDPVSGSYFPQNFDPASLDAFFNF